MKTSIRRPKSARKASSASRSALGRYLAAGLGATGLASVDSEAAVVSIDISSVSAPNGGVAPGNIENFIFTTAEGTAGFRLFNTDDGLGFAALGAYNAAVDNSSFISSGGLALPTNFPASALISASLPQGSAWVDDDDSATLFNYYGNVSPNFGANSFLGFRFESGTDFHYGYFEVTWDNVENEFQILSGAYESTPNTPIAVPEPTGVALAGIGALALGAGAIRRSRKARKAAAEGTLAEAV